MKILVITFSRGLNPGTFMQAYGVRTGLLKIFPNAEINYLSFPDFKWDKGKRGKKDFIGHVLLQKAFAAYRLLKYRKLEQQVFSYTPTIDLFDYDIDKAKSILRKYDLVVVGSDTILEKVTNGSQQLGLNWGSSELCKSPHLFFAASASPANFSGDKQLLERLKGIAERFIYIGLRDGLTLDLFNNKMKVNVPVYKQPDPSYYLDINEFQLSEHYVRKLKGKKIAFYNFSPNFPYRKELADLIRKKGYTVVSSVYNPYADIKIDTIGPKEWAGIFRHCDIIITERFHDSLFALRNCKPVIAIDWEKDRFSSTGDSKTYRILKDYDLQNYHFILEDKNQLASIIDKIPQLMSDFDTAHIIRKNEEYTTLAMNLLKVIKQNYDEFLRLH